MKPRRCANGRACSLSNQWSPANWDGSRFCGPRGGSVARSRRRLVRWSATSTWSLSTARYKTSPATSPIHWCARSTHCTWLQRYCSARSCQHSSRMTTDSRPRPRPPAWSSPHPASTHRRPKSAEAGGHRRGGNAVHPGSSRGTSLREELQDLLVEPVGIDRRDGVVGGVGRDSDVSVRQEPPRVACRLADV